ATRLIATQNRTPATIAFSKPFIGPDYPTDHSASRLDLVTCHMSHVTFLALFSTANDQCLRRKTHFPVKEISFCCIGCGLFDRWMLRGRETGQCFAQVFRHLTPQLPELLKRDWRFDLKLQRALNHIYRAGLFHDRSQFAGNSKAECVRCIRVLFNRLNEPVS